MISILDLEQNFLIGKYATVLTCGNQYLSATTTALASTSALGVQQKEHGSILLLLLNVPLHLKCDINGSTTTTTRYIHIHLPPIRNVDDGNDETIVHIQKVGAMVLQSWYELFKQEKQKQQLESDYYDDDTETGYRLLQPFLNIFTATTTTVTSSSSSTIESLHNFYMSIELFVIFIRFLASSVIGQEVEAILLIVEFLHSIRSTLKSTHYVTTADQTSCCCCQEIMLYFFTEMLPQYCYSVSYGKKILDYIKSGDSNTTTTTHNHDDDSMHTTITAMIQEYKTQQQQQQQHNSANSKEIIQLCIQFCNTDDDNWSNDYVEAFCQCRKILQQQLNVIHCNTKKPTVLFYTNNNYNNDNEEQRDTPTIQNNRKNDTVVNVSTKQDWMKNSILPFQLLRMCQNIRSILVERLQQWKSAITITQRCSVNIISSLSSYNLIQKCMQRIDSIRIVCMMTIVIYTILQYQRRHVAWNKFKFTTIWKLLQESMRAIRNQ